MLLPLPAHKVAGAESHRDNHNGRQHSRFTPLSQARKSLYGLPKTPRQQTAEQTPRPSNHGPPHGKNPRPTPGPTDAGGEARAQERGGSPGEDCPEDSRCQASRSQPRHPPHGHGTEPRQKTSARTPKENKVRTTAVQTVTVAVADTLARLGVQDDATHALGTAATTVLGPVTTDDARNGKAGATPATRKQHGLQIMLVQLDPSNDRTRLVRKRNLRVRLPQTVGIRQVILQGHHALRAHFRVSHLFLNAPVSSKPGTPKYTNHQANSVPFSVDK